MKIDTYWVEATRIPSGVSRGLEDALVANTTKGRTGITYMIPFATIVSFSERAYSCGVIVIRPDASILTNTCLCDIGERSDCLDTEMIRDDGFLG